MEEFNQWDGRLHVKFFMLELQQKLLKPMLYSIYLKRRKLKVYAYLMLNIKVFPLSVRSLI